MKYDYDSMYLELQSAKRQTKRHLTHYREMISEFVTPWANEAVVTEYEPENHAYQRITTTMPQKVFDNPGWSIETDRPGEYQTHARLLERFMNNWNREVDLQRFLADGPCRDMDFAIGIALVRLDDAKASGFKSEGSEEAYVRGLMPKVERISPESFIWDPVASCEEDALFFGHRTIWDREELLDLAEKEKGWNVESIKAACAYTGHDDIEEARKREGLKRDEVVIWYVWCRKIKQWLTLFDDACQVNPGKWPREPQDAYGPECGTYAFFRGEKVPEQFFPLPSLIATRGQQKDFNAVSNAVTDQIEAFKEFVISNDQTVANAIVKDPTHHVYYSPTMKQENIWQGKIGGLTPEMMAGFEFKRERLDANSGMTEAQRGQTNTGATATADVIANTAAQLRMSGEKSAVEYGTNRIGYIVAWYAFHEPQIAMYMGESQQGAVWFRGGPMGKGDKFEFYRLSIKAYSMERPSEAQRATRVQFYTQVLPQLALVMPQTPQINWGYVFEELADSMGMPDLPKVLNQEFLQAETALSVQQRVAAAQPEQGAPGGVPPPPMDGTQQVAPRPAPKPVSQKQPQVMG